MPVDIVYTCDIMSKQYQQYLHVICWKIIMSQLQHSPWTLQMTYCHVIVSYVITHLQVQPEHFWNYICIVFPPFLDMAAMTGCWSSPVNTEAIHCYTTLAPLLYQSHIQVPLHMSCNLFMLSLSLFDTTNISEWESLCLGSFIIWHVVL